MIIIKNRQKRRLLIIIFSLCIVLYTQSAEAFWHNLKSPFPAIKIENELPVLKRSKCKNPPAPPKDLNFVSIYSNTNTSSSIINKAAQERYRGRTKNIWAYERQISNWVQNIRNKKNKSYSLTCSIFWLEAWAKENALLKVETSPQGKAVRKWHLAVISSHYIQIKHLITKQQQFQIENWIRNLAKQVIEDYPNNSSRMSHNNNHQYWAAWSVIITGITLNDRQLYQHGIQVFKRAMQQINKNGSLPLELKRQSKAFHYHLFSLSPLVMIAETAKINGYNLYKYRSNALLNLIEFTLEEINNEQNQITKLTGVKQDLTRSITGGQLAWLVPYSVHYNDDSVQDLINQFSPMKQRRIGGDLSQIYFGYAQIDN